MGRAGRASACACRWARAAVPRAPGRRQARDELEAKWREGERGNLVVPRAPERRPTRDKLVTERRQRAPRRQEK
jgi:hypothetical protein